MSRERILEVMEGRRQETPEDGDSTGIGLDNVVSRLESVSYTHLDVYKRQQL